MNATELARERTGGINQAAHKRILLRKGEPLFLANWERAVFIHYEVDAKILQREVPFQLDLHDGKAYVSLVAFHLKKMRPRLGGKFTEFLTMPVATHGLLNVRTYIRHENETGIYFLAEFLPNKLSLHFGPPLYGLPYRLGKPDYNHRHENHEISGSVSSGEKLLNYRINLRPNSNFQPCEANTLDEFLLERYTAFTVRNGIRRLFRIWHPPWPQIQADAEIAKEDLLSITGEWIRHSRLSGAHYSPGFENVWMGRPQRL